MTSGSSARAAGSALGDGGVDAANARSQRRELAKVWLWAASAVAAAIGSGWVLVIRNGGRAPGGDMIGHAAAAQWLRTLEWWDWRGWSDWFYGGQAIGVNYPPLGHFWMRLTDPVHGQMAAVAIGLLVILPWGALRLARAVGYSPRAQRAAVAAVLVLTAAAGNMHWMLSGFHEASTFYGSWPAMIAAVVGLHVAADAARCRRPVTAGLLAGVAGLFNATVAPGVAVVCLALLVSSGASARQGVRWAMTAGAAALAVSAWWLVPFVHGWDRLVRWEVPLRSAWSFGGEWQPIALAILAAAAAWAARSCGAPSRRLALAAGAALLATMVADLFNYLRPERWLEMPILVAVIAAAALLGDRRHSSPTPTAHTDTTTATVRDRHSSPTPTAHTDTTTATVRDRDSSPDRAAERHATTAADLNGGRSVAAAARPTWVLLGAAFIVVFAVVTLRVEFLPLAVWLALRDRTTPAAWGGALTWAAVLLWVPLAANVSGGDLPDDDTMTPLDAALEAGGPDAAGLVDLDWLYNSSWGGLEACAWGHPWETTVQTAGQIRPLFGLYQESSAAAEFIQLDLALNGNQGTLRRHWSEAWDDAGNPPLQARPQAEALGARWYAQCDADGEVSVTEMRPVDAQGVGLDLHSDGGEWIRAAADWWIAIAAHEPASPVRTAAAAASMTHPEPGSAQVRPRAAETAVPASMTGPEPESASARLTAAETAAVPTLMTGGFDAEWANWFPPYRPASDLTVQPGPDTLTLVAEVPGWAWIRVPWDPYWSTENEAPVLKGGPGHLIVWATQGETVLHWRVPAGVDATAAVVTGVALLIVVGLADINSRLGWDLETERRRPAAQAVGVFADTVDSWTRAAGRAIRKRASWVRRKGSPTRAEDSSR